MLRAFSQGISLSSRMSYFEYSTKKIVTTTAGKVQMNLVLLDLLCGNIDNLRVNVPLRVNDFLSTYWVLSFQNLTGNFEVTEDIFPSEKYVYNTLANFISDSAASIEIR